MVSHKAVCKERFDTYKPDLSIAAKKKLHSFFKIHIHPTLSKYFDFIHNVLTAIMSLSGSLYYSNKSNLYQERTTTGKSLVCAGIGGGFQIILVNDLILL